MEIHVKNGMMESVGNSKTLNIDEYKTGYNNL